MNHFDVKSFFIDEAELESGAYLFLTYCFETSGDPHTRAAELCSEMSTAQWQRPGVSEDFRVRFGAKVVHLEVQEKDVVPTFPRFVDGRSLSRVLVRIAYPHRNFGAKIPNLLTAICGEGAFYAPGIHSIKLLDIDFPAQYLAEFSGPRYGIEALRAQLDVYDRPLFFGVVKPNVGLPPADFAELAYQAWLGGLDVAKDDEMLGDAEYSPFAKRCRLAGEKCKLAQDKTGKPKIYLANITDEVSNLRKLHDIALEYGAKAVMINGFATGLSAVRMLSQHSQVPVVAHFDFLACFSRHPNFGVSSLVMTKLQRVAGFDAIIMPGFGARMFSEEDEVLDNVDACLTGLSGMKRALPVPGGSDWAGTLPDIYKKLKSIDFALVPGRGVFAHPQGAEAGAKSLHEAWGAISENIPLEDYAAHHPALAQALEAFGGIKLKQKPFAGPKQVLKQFVSRLDKN